MVGTSLGGNQLAEYDFRNSTVTDSAGIVDLPIVAPGTTIYLSLFCVLGSAGYALFSSATVKQVTTLTHSIMEVMHDDLALGSAAYTASNSTLATANVFNIGNGKGDNAVSITNVGAVFGQARRNNGFPTVSGRQYKASALWVPHSAPIGDIKIGTAVGLNDIHAGIAMNADLDSTVRFFNAASGLRWNFTNTNDGWVSTNITPTNNATYISLVSTTVDPNFSKSGLSFSGLSNRYVATRITRKAGAWVNELQLYYSTAGHGYSASYYTQANVATLVVDETTIIVWDMWQLIAGGTDWKDNTITGLRIDYTNANAVTWQVDWIAIGNLNPLEVTFTATGSTSYVSFNNSNQSNVVSYYILPHCDQVDSTYTLSQVDVSANDPTDEYIVSETRTIAGVSYGLYDRLDEGWSIVSYKIEDAAKADWDEFFASCCALETFRFDPSATTDTTTTKTCELVPGSQKLARIGNTSMWRAQFKVRVAA